MRRYILIITGALCCAPSIGQQADTLRLEICMRMATERSQFNRQRIISGETLSNRTKNLGTNWFPAIGFNAQAIYNSETIDFADIMGNTPVPVPSLPLDQYKIWADISQQLYDGGFVRTQKAIEKVNYETDEQQVESELLRVRQQVNQVYFALLINQTSSAVLQVTLDEFVERIKTIQAGVNHGVVLPENMLAMEAEDIRIRQRLTELRLAREQLLGTMYILMDTVLIGKQVIVVPREPENGNELINRPELMVFDKQEELLQTSKRLISANDLPRLFAFSQVAYGRPGYNMLSEDFHAFFSAGLGMKWNFLNYGDSRRQKKILDLQKGIVDVRRETFSDQLNIQLNEERTNVKKYDELLEQDEKILELRKSIAAISLSKLTSGIITSTDNLIDLNAEVLARLQYEHHKILRLKSMYDYRLLQGNL